MSHFVVALVGGVPEGGSRGLLLVRHHTEQLLNLEAVGTLQRGKHLKTSPPGIRERWSRVILAAATYAT